MRVAEFFKKRFTKDNLRAFFAKRSVKVAALILAGATAAAAVAVPVSLLRNRGGGSGTSGLPGVSGGGASSAPPGSLVIVSPELPVSETTEPYVIFRGSSDPEVPLTVNGDDVERDGEGDFTLRFELDEGDNRFTFLYKGEEFPYTVRYKYVLIRSVSPSGSRSYEGGSVFGVAAVARTGSTVTATFHGQTVTLSEVPPKEEEDTVFSSFQGEFTLPAGGGAAQNLGKVVFEAKFEGRTETRMSGDISCKKAGAKTVGEVVAFSAETFDAAKGDWLSRPTNNYFPKGTRDYVTGHMFIDGYEFLLLRCGRKIALSKELKPGGKETAVAREYDGELPAENAVSLLGVRRDARHTVLTVSSEWKAPFFLDYKEQTYVNPATQDYRVDPLNIEYIEIEFCYADELPGEINLAANPLFSRAEKVKSASGNACLRLYLKKKNGFYGWDAEYNAAGELEFTFLHPAQVAWGDNEYGVSLDGVRIMIDVGHGGIDPGAIGVEKSQAESVCNMRLALKIKEELESLGAGVTLNRDGDVTVNSDRRCVLLKEAKPDLCIAVHHDSGASGSVCGYGVYYSSPFSSTAAQAVYDAIERSGIYSYANSNRLRWHYYYVARMTVAPVVLTENGYVSSSLDMKGITDDETNTLKAKAIVRGVAEYFRSISDYPPAPPASSQPQESSSSSPQSSEPEVPSSGEPSLPSPSSSAASTPSGRDETSESEGE